MWVKKFSCMWRETTVFQLHNIPAFRHDYGKDDVMISRHTSTHKKLRAVMDVCTHPYLGFHHWTCAEFKNCVKSAFSKTSGKLQLSSWILNLPWRMAVLGWKAVALEQSLYAAVWVKLRQSARSHSCKVFIKQPITFTIHKCHKNCCKQLTTSRHKLCPKGIGTH